MVSYQPLQPKKQNLDFLKSTQLSKKKSLPHLALHLLLRLCRILRSTCTYISVCGIIDCIYYISISLFLSPPPTTSDSRLVSIGRRRYHEYRSTGSLASAADIACCLLTPERTLRVAQIEYNIIHVFEDASHSYFAPIASRNYVRSVPYHIPSPSIVLSVPPSSNHRGEGEFGLVLECILLIWKCHTVSNMRPNHIIPYMNAFRYVYI